MADNSSGSGGNVGGNRAARDALRSSSSRASTDRDAPRVRFSQDLDRITPAGDEGRSGTPNLTIDTQTTPENQRGIQGGGSANMAASPTSPISPRTRDRGYSLRRSLFARTINGRPADAPIELVEAGSSQAQDRSARMLEEGLGKSDGKRPRTAVTVSPVYENDVPVHTARASGKYTDSLPSKGRERNVFPSLSLPNYDQWARSRIQENSYVRRAKAWKDKATMVIMRRTPIPPSKDGRHIDLDASRTKPLIDERTGKEHIANSIRSSRYTVWNFVPRQLIFQFSKLANAYFLLVSILQMIPGLSPTGSYTTIAPLLVFVTISMGKEGYDDVRRYKLDKIENNRETLVLQSFRVHHADKQQQFGARPKSLVPSNGQIKLGSRESSEDYRSSTDSRHWTCQKWRDIKVGDIIKLKRDDHIPADVVLLYATGVNGIAYIETMALDGETNLKSKQAPTSLAKRCGSEEEIAACHAHIVVEDPNIDLYNFDGRVTVDGETLPLTTNEVIFRGSTLRNTASAVALVINTGEDCKIRMNANKNPRIKAPAIQVCNGGPIVSYS